MIFPNLDKVKKKKKKTSNKTESVATGSLLDFLGSKLDNSQNKELPTKKVEKREGNSLIENTPLAKIITGIKDSRNEMQNTKNIPNQNITNATSKSDESYNELMAYKKKNNINLFNENSKRVKNDKKYQQLLKNAQKDITNSQKVRQEESVNNLNFDNGITSGIEKTGMALAGGFATGVSGIESTAKKILGQTPSVEDNELKYGMLNDLSNKAIDETNSEIGKAGLSIANSIGQMIPQMAIGNPTGSTITGFANYGGSAYNEAKKNGATEEQATKYGIVSGTLEMTMEKALGGFESIYGKSMSGKFTKNVMDKLIKNKALRKTLSSMNGEFTEEYLQEFLEPILKNAILEEDNGVDFWNTMKDDIGTGIKQLGNQLFNKENLYAGVLGAATSGIMEGPQNIVRNNWSKKTSRDFDTGYTQNEQKVLDELINKEVSKKSKEQAINIEIENTIKNQSIMLSKENKQKIADRIRKEYENKNIDISKTKLSEKETKKIRESIEKQLQDGSIDTNEITNILGKDTDLSKDDYLQRSFYEKSQRSNNYQYEENKNDSEITSALKQSASRVMNNTTKSRNFVDNVIKIAEDKGTRYEFVNNEQLEQMGYDIKGKDINGLVGKDSQGNEKVLINIDSNQSLNKIVGHETTHLLEGTEEYTLLQNTIKEYAKSKGDYDNRLKSMEQLYSGLEANIENEVTSDLVGEYLFNDEEFINHLSTTEPNVFTKIYDYIKHLYKTITADSQQARDLEKVKYRFEQAYKQNIKEKISNESEFSLSKNTLQEVSDVINQTREEAEKNQIHLVKLKDNTIKKLVDYGIKDLPMLERSGHIRENILTKEQAEKLGYSTKNKHFHGLGVKTYLEIIDSMDNPIGVYQYTDKGNYNSDNFIVVTPIQINDTNYIVPIEINQKGQYNQVEIDYNKIKTAYSKDNNNYIQNLINQGKIKEIYDGSNSRRTSLDKSNIPQSTENVNSDISNNNISKNNVNDTKYSLSDTNKSVNDKIERTLQKGSYKAMNIANKVANSYLDFDYQEKKSFKEQLSKFSNMTREELTNVDTYKDIRNIVNQYANKEYTYVDEQVDSIKKQIKNSKIMINDDLKNQITDYSDFKKQSKLKLGKEGQAIDSLYQELSNTYPYYFSNEITTEADMLYELSNFMNQDFSITEKYRIPDEDLKFYSDKIFNKLIDNSISQNDINELQQQLEKKVERRTRKIVQQELLNKMNLKIGDFEIGNDIGNIAYQRTDPVRVNEKVFGYQMGTKINDATVNFTKHQEAERTRWLNKERDDIKNLGIKARSKESSAVQKYGEGFFINDKGEKIDYTEADLENEFSNPKVREKIKHASEIIRNKYDSYIEQINSTLTELGYDEIPKRKDYFRHFEELTDKLSQWGVPFNRNDMMAEDLPTDINGLTEMNKPGKNYFASANQRTGLKTIYDAITGIDGYLEGASNLIFHTESIQRYRAVTRLVRESYGREHGLDDIDLLTDEELQQRIDNIRGNKLSRYVAWLDEQANALAGKKGAIDRGVERVLGRKVYTALNTLKSQVGSNMVGFNIRTPLTNFASVVQGASKTEKISFLKGTVSTINNIFHKDELIDKSDFLTSRFGSDMLSQKVWQKVSNAGQILMTASDYFTANQIWRSKYYENLSKGMTEEASIKNADDFSAKIMGDRTKGATAEMFNSKTLGFLTQFQLETNNQWSSMFHDNKMAKENGEKTTAGVLFSLGQLFVGSHLFNMFMENIGAGDVMPDPVEMLMKLFNPDDDKPIGDRIAEVRDEIIGQIPMGNMLSENGRFPISEALPIKQLLYGTDSNGNEKSRVETLLETLPYYLLPGGYSQIKKTTKGLSMYDDKLPIAGSYTKSGNLRFSADESISGKIKAGLFGQYSSESAQDYIDSGFKSINKSKLDEMKDLDMNSTEYRNYRQGLSDAGKSKENKLEYINNLDVSTDKKSIMASGLLKKDIDMSDYNKYGSYEEFDYSVKNPEKYKMITTITDYDNYQDIMKNIKNIKSDVKKNGSAVSGSRMKKVISYVNSLDLSAVQKAMIIKQEYPSFKQYDKKIAQYINKQDISFLDKAYMLKQLGFTSYDKQIMNYVKKNRYDERIAILEKLGFKIYTYNGKTYVKG